MEEVPQEPHPPEQDTPVELSNEISIARMLVAFQGFLERDKKLTSHNVYNHLLNVSKFIDEYNIEGQGDITTERIFKFCEEKIRANTRYFSIKYLCDFLGQQTPSMIKIAKEAKSQLKSKYKSLKGIPRLKQNKAFSDEELKEFFLQCKEERGHNYYLIFRIQYETASRISEICDLTVKEITTLKDGRIKLSIKIKKTGFFSETKTCYLTKETSNLLAEYLKNNDYMDETNKINSDSTSKLFNESSNTCKNFMRAAAREKFGEDKSRWFSTHWLRHTAVTNVILKTGNIALARELAGHKNVNTTMTYFGSSGLNNLRTVKEVFEDEK